MIKVDIREISKNSVVIYVDGRRFKKLTNYGLAWAHAQTVVQLYEFIGQEAKMGQ